MHDVRPAYFDGAAPTSLDKTRQEMGVGIKL